MGFAAPIASSAARSMSSGVTVCPWSARSAATARTALGHGEIVRSDVRVELERARRHRRANSEAVAVRALQHLQRGHTGEIDDIRRFQETVLHLRQQVCPAGHDLRVAAALAENL